MTHQTDRWTLAAATGCIAVMAAATAVPLTASARHLTVVSWGGRSQEAQDIVFFQPFQRDTGIKLQQASWTGGIGILRAKVLGGNLDWDLVQVESDELAIGCEEGLYVELDWSKIGGKDIYYPEAVNRCGVGTFFYNFVLGYDGDKLKEGPNGWVDFFDLTKYPGKRGLRRGPKTSLEIALMGDGVAREDVYKLLATDAGVARAFKKLDSIKDRIIWWQTGTQSTQLLHANEVTMVAVYNGRITTAARTENRNFKKVWKGSLFTLDSWVILKGSPNVDAAHKFLHYYSDPNRQKDFPKYLYSGMPNKKTIELVDKDLLPDVPTTPENLVNSLEIDVEFWLNNFDRLNDRYTKWAAQ